MVNANVFGRQLALVRASAFVAGVGLAVGSGGCIGRQDETVAQVGGTPEIIRMTQQPLAAANIQWINGTYGASCAQNASGSWSLGVATSTGMTNSALSVVKNNTACVLTLTAVVANVASTSTVYNASSGITLGSSYGSAASFATSAASTVKAFYADAFITPANFSANFALTLAYSDDPRNLTGSVSHTYTTVTASSSTSLVSAPDYTFAAGSLAIQTDANSVVTANGGSATLTVGSNAGQSYVIDTTLGASPTFDAINTAYNAGTAVAIATAPSGSSLLAIGTTLPTTRNIIVQNISNGVIAYEVIRVTFS